MRAAQAEPVRAALAVLRVALAVLRAVLRVAMLELADLAGMAASADMVLATSGLLEGSSTLQAARMRVTKLFTLVAVVWAPAWFPPSGIHIFGSNVVTQSRKRTRT